MWLDVYPDRAFYRPGETVRLSVDAVAPVDASVQVVASVTFLSGEVARLVQPLHLVAGEAAVAELSWRPPAVAPRGYGVDLQLVDGDRVLVTAATGFDVLDRWTQAPRYGFLTDFSPDRIDFDRTMRWLIRYHVNGLQFYDWMYRHEQLLPPSNLFDDPLGRRLSLATVEGLIAAAHARGMAAMPYTAVYAASVPFFQQHPDWGLRDATGQPIPFGEDFLMVMDPSPGSPWAEHLLCQFAEVLEKIPFDGIHLDQYGDPKVGFDAQGHRIDLASALAAFIGAARRVVPEGTLIFNAVGNWPIETVAPSEQDVVYIEVWPPYTRFQDLHRLIVEAQRLGGGKPVVLAAYVDPAHARNVRLVDAVIFASGGFHIELGEPGGMLADPYFPRYGCMSDELAQVVRRYYDFAVRYGNVLSLGTHDATALYEGRVVVEGVSAEVRLNDGIWPIVRHAEDAIGLSLINMVGVGPTRWDDPSLADRPILEDVVVRFYTDRPVTRAWWASPDLAIPRPRALRTTPGSDDSGSFVTFVVPSLAYWDLIVLEREKRTAALR